MLVQDSGIFLMIDRTAILTVSCVLAAMSFPYILGNIKEPEYAKVPAVFGDSILNRPPLSGSVDQNVVTVQYCDS